MKKYFVRDNDIPVSGCFSLNMIEIFYFIQSRHTKKITKKIRKLIDLGELHQAKEARRELFTFGPHEWDSDKPGPMKFEYSGLISLEILDVDYKNSKELLKRIEAITYCHGWYRNLNKSRITLLVLVDSESENHELAFNQTADYFEKALNKKVDRTDANIPKWNKITYSSKTYLNMISEVFHVNIDNN
ncbi:MAG TPA: hypothetical protein DHV28_16465 [Ignavibacteriales bacterium]|nr:hypothetical protein [Ignavibacteriales bacterium]